MTPYQKRLTPHIERMAGDMKIRNFAQATIDAYTYHVGKFADFIKKPLVDATVEDIRSYQLCLIEVRKLGWSSFNQAVCGLRFLYTHTYPKSWPVTMIPFGKRPKRLPVVLGGDEVEALFQCTENLKHRTILMTLYSAGLRSSEGANLRIPDIDSSRMQLHIVGGKGNKDRMVPLSTRLLAALREYWKEYQPTEMLFPGSLPEAPMAPTSIQKAIKLSAQRAGINKNISPHTLRHSFATGLLEAGVDILTISRLLGHSSFTTTMIYLHCRTEHLGSVPSPLDLLPVHQLPKWQQNRKPKS